MAKDNKVDIAIIGAGFAGIATAYYLCKKYGQRSVMLIDSRDPMSYTSAQSGDNYRNWWPSKVMTDFSNHSIDLMHGLALESSNALRMQQRGYALATRSHNIDDLVQAIEGNHKQLSRPLADLVRVHRSSNPNSYMDPHNSDWQSTVTGVDVLSNKDLIRQTFPAFGDEIQNVLHIRKAGDISGQQMGQFMLQAIKPLGCDRIRSEVVAINRGADYELELNTNGLTSTLRAETLVNAAGPFINQVGAMLEVELPIENIFHQKIAFEDKLKAVPRNQPFSIDLDIVNLDWSSEERDYLSSDAGLKWLTEPISGGVHCRPEGAGKWIKLGWAYNRNLSTPQQEKELIEDPHYDALFPEIVLRGAAKLNPELKPYIETLPTNRAHYGGCYTMTKENWPLIGPMNDSGAFVVGALSGYGSMTACASGELCAAWVCGAKLPEYAHALSPNRYQDLELMAELNDSSDLGLL